MNKTSFLTCLLLALGAATASPAALADVSVSINIAPPMLPVYEQPPPPADDFLWMPGYWAYDEDGYFWVPGTWVMAPRRGYLWTPGYWAWNDGLYYWNGGYWGPTVGFYGGVYYGYGYSGSGYDGGRWDGDHFYYNRSVNNVSVTTVHNTYNQTVTNNVTVNRVSYNGGTGGTTVHPAPRERDAAAAQHLQPTTEQVQHEHGARGNHALRASVNNGSPPIAATPRPGAFTERAAPPARSDQEKRPSRAQGKATAPAAQPADDANVMPRGRRGGDSRKESAPRAEPPTRSAPERSSPMREPREPAQRRQPRDTAPQDNEPGQSAPPRNRRDAAPQENEPRQPAKKGKRQKDQGPDPDQPSEDTGAPPDRKH